CEAAVDETEFVLEVADAELDVGGRPLDFTDEVGVDAEQFGVPADGGAEIVDDEVGGGESSQHGGCSSLVPDCRDSLFQLKCSSTEHFSGEVGDMRADRLVAALSFLQHRGRVTAAELAAELEVSVATARRDLEALAAAGIPVYPQAGRGGGWALVGGARTDL